MSVIPYDEVSVDAVATALDLRDPNRRALDAIAQQLAARDVGCELVADLATGVGKTYIAGGLLDYLWGQGVRNVMIVTPGSTIQRKTVANLTPGNRKYLSGLACNPLVVTLDDFERGTVGAALDDPGRFKVFVFTVQSLLRPNTKDNRRAHRPHETLGQSLSDYLRNADDLVIVADEHHVYFNRTANQFRRAIDDLAPSALIGLTATPHDSTDPDKIVYRYPLADAIADGYVKIPVLVARRDGRADLRTQLADGCALIEVKEAAMRAYCAATRAPYVQPVLFVVASSIDEAGQIRDTLASQDFLGGAEKVLLVTSEEPDEIITQLDTLEDPASPVKAVVSVQMLGIGWDVKNVYAIAAVRALESQLLTEQVLGRGLRLPFGRRTGVPMLDTVEVLSHHAFATLLDEAKVLLAQTLGERAEEVTVLPATDSGVAGGDDAAVTGNEGGPGAEGDGVPAGTADGGTGTTGGDESEPVELVVEPVESVSMTLPGAAGATVTPIPGQGALLDTSGEGDQPGNDDSEHQVFGVSTVESRLDDGQQTAEALTTPILAHTPDGTRLPLYLPQVTWTWRRDPFSLTSLDLTAVEAQGAVWANDNAPTLRRKVLDAERDTTGVSLRISDARQSVAATTETMPFDTIEPDLVGRVLRSNTVGQTVTEYNAAVAVAQAFLSGAGVTEETPWRAEHGRLATDALTGWIGQQQTSTPAWQVPEVSQARWPEPATIIEPRPPADRHRITNSRRFVRGYPYEGWTRSFFPVATFDSYSAEFRLAETLDTTGGIKAWQRITSTVPLTVRYQDGGRERTYIPDFLVIDDNGVHWLVEGKADNQMQSAEVAAKRDGAKRWVDAVNADTGIAVRWGYLLLSESVIAGADTWAELKAAGHTYA